MYEEVIKAVSIIGAVLALWAGVLFFVIGAHDDDDFDPYQ